MTDIQALERAASARIGSILSEKYQLEALLGFGGTAAVYVATNVYVGRPCAIKVLHGEHRREPELVERFKREAFAANRVRIEGQAHPNVVDIVDAGESDGQLYLVQELLHGETLADYLDEQPERRLSAEVTVALMRPVLHAIAVGHSVGVVHRDLKPENVFLVDRSALGKPPLPKVLDFGIAQLQDARITVKDRMHGTPAYMAPEAFTDPLSVDARADVWGLGLMLYELLSGQNPFARDNESWMAEIHAVQTQPVPVLSVEGVPIALEALVRRALSKDRTMRFENAASMLHALDRALDPDNVLEVASGSVAEHVRESVAGGELRCNGLRFCAPWSSVGEMLAVLELEDFSPLRTLVLAEATEESLANKQRNMGANELVVAIAQSPACRSLTELTIGGSNLTVAGVIALTATAAFATLRTLSLPRNRLGDLGAVAIADAPHWSGLTALDLSSNAIGDEGARAIAQGMLASLTSLDLSHNRITDVGARWLVESASLTQLACMNLDGNPLSAELIAELSARTDRLYLLSPS
ncbi:MAG: protein kinase [Deltaproteobacteria bacterium]|nr:protein kinase [Deltaproteobacteria bacterium]